MLSLRVITSSFLLFTFFTAATPLTSIAARDGYEFAGPQRRGVAYNNPSFVKYFDVAGSHMTWTYNWDSRTGATNTWHEFVPMLHSNRPESTGKWNGDVHTAAMFNTDWPTHLLAFNEPDNCDSYGGVCMDVDTAVAAWKQWMEPQRELKDKMQLGSPAVTNGLKGLPWLVNFLIACDGCHIDFINIHWYDSALNAAYFKTHINEARKISGGRPIWITEFKASGSDDQVAAFLDDVLPWLDQSSDIHRYAYFMAATGDGLLIENGGTGLSDVGRNFTFHA